MKVYRALPHQRTNWETILWRKVIQHVTRLQRRIAKAVKQGHWAKAKALMHLVTKSFYAKLLAVLRVSTNKGGNTPGVDNTVWTNSKENSKQFRNSVQGVTGQNHYAGFTFQRKTGKSVR